MKQKVLSFFLLFSFFNIVTYAQNSSALSLQDSFREVAQISLPFVVEIITEDIVETSDPISLFFGGQSPDRVRSGLGSGFFVRKTKDTYYILTNNHVVENANTIKVKSYQGKQYAATLVGGDPLKDLALISINTKDTLPIAVLGDSDKLQVGDIVFAVGNPLGFESSITQGIVSALGRSQSPTLNALTDYIQTDASINQGNSGGALVNLRGEVVGINSWIASKTGGNIGLGFSIPINNARRTIDDFINTGSARYGWLGINMGELSENLAKEIKTKNTMGAFVYNVYDKSPAAQSGIQAGDYIIAVNGKSIQSISQFSQTVANLEADQIVNFTVIRNNKERELKVKIGLRSSAVGQNSSLWPGVSIITLTNDIRKELKISRSKGSLIIVGVIQDGILSESGLQRGDIILSINGKKMNTLTDFYNIINSAPKLTFALDRQGREIELTVSHQ